MLRVGRRRHNSEISRDAGSSEVVGMKHFNGPTSSTLMYATDDGSLRGLDLRMRDVAFDVRLETRLGNVTALCAPPSDEGVHTWAAVGTDRGYVAVWDLRFMTVGKVWRHSSRRPIRRLMSVGGGWNQGGGGGGEGGADDSGSLESGEGSLEEELDHLLRGTTTSAASSSGSGRRGASGRSTSPSRETTLKRRGGRRGRYVGSTTSASDLRSHRDLTSSSSSRSSTSSSSTP